MTRDLLRRGHRAVGIDPSATLVGYAREADPTGTHLQARAEALPFEAGAFDLVVSYNSLMVIEGLDRAVTEAARVLEPGKCRTEPRRLRWRI